MRGWLEDAAMCSSARAARESVSMSDDVGMEESEIESIPLPE